MRSLFRHTLLLSVMAAAGCTGSQVVIRHGDPTTTALDVAINGTPIGTLQLGASTTQAVAPGLCTIEVTGPATTRTIELWVDGTAEVDIVPAPVGAEGDTP